MYIHTHINIVFAQPSLRWCVCEVEKYMYVYTHTCTHSATEDDLDTGIDIGGSNVRFRGRTLRSASPGRTSELLQSSASSSCRRLRTADMFGSPDCMSDPSWFKPQEAGSGLEEDRRSVPRCRRGVGGSEGVPRRGTLCLRFGRLKTRKTSRRNGGRA